MTIEEIIKDLKGMPTIEERAKTYSKTQAIECYAYCGYERGAIEQQEIDVEKACKWIAKNIEDCIFYGMPMDEILTEFKKAMKGE